MKYIGIDPGKMGAVAILDESDNLRLLDIPRIGNEIDIKGLFDIINEATSGDHIVGLEDVHAIPGAGAMQSFQFGRVLGMKEGILIGSGARYVKVAPKTWQKEMWQGVPPLKKANGKNDTKSSSLLAAMRWFPNQKFLKSKDGQVDAALLALYIKMRYGN